MTLTVITQHLDGLVDPIDGSTEKFNEYMEQVFPSSVAINIYHSLNGSGYTIGVLLIDQTANSMYIPPFIFNGGGVYSGGVAVLNVLHPLKIGGRELPLGVSLIHELGHALQYIENPIEFTTAFEAAQSASGARMKFNITDVEGRALTKYYKITDIAKLEIENDNVARHEAPICDELGLPFRKKYS